eukprot:gene12900-13026_t
MQSMLLSSFLAFAYLTAATQVAGNVHMQSTAAVFTASVINSSAITLSWSAATTAVYQYRIYRNSSLHLALPPSELSYTDVSLAPSTTYSYQLRAYRSAKQYTTIGKRVIATTTPAAVVVIAPSGTTSLPIRTPDVVRGFTPDATGVPFNWGNMDPWAFVQYQVTTEQQVTCALTVLESSWGPNAAVNVFLNGPLLGRVGFRSKESWETYLTSYPLLLTLPRGRSTLKVQDATTNGFNLAGLDLTVIDAASLGGGKGINSRIMRLNNKAAAAREAAMLADLGVTWVRFDFPWSEIQWFGPQEYAISGYDIAVRALAAKGINVLDQMVPPDDSYIGAFADFCTYLVQRYAPLGVHAWEIWNEPNIVNFWATGADPARYTVLLKAAYTAIKAADPLGFVVTAGLAPACNCEGNMQAQDFLSGIYTAGGGGYFDAVGMHPYTYPQLPNSTDGSAYWWTAMEAELRPIMEQNGDADKQIWSTEFGAPTNGPEDGSFVTERNQAVMLSTAHQLIQAYPWAGPLFWYVLRDPGEETNTVENFFGIVRFNKSKKPAYAALKAVRQKR